MKKYTFTRTNKTVHSDRYVAYAMYTQNKALVEQLGGTVVKGNKCFTAEFPSVKKANEFVKNAITSMPKAEYEATRKNAPAKKAQTEAPKKSTKNASAPAPKSAGKKPQKSTKGNAKETWKSDLNALKGKGRSANKEAAAILRKYNMSTQIGSEGWDYWTSIR